MDKVNLLSNEKFPMYREGLNMIQEAAFMAAKSMLIGGNNYILDGCNLDENNNVSSGYIVVNGEILPFVGGKLNDRFSIVETRKTLNAFGVDYPEAYIFRVAQFTNNGAFNWSDFEPIQSNAQLYKLIKNITGDPVGVIKEFAGFVSKMPKDYMLCDGRDMSVAEYPELFEMLGTIYGGDGVNFFKLPNTGGRVSVGYTGAGDYATQGNTGGAESVTLTVDQLANHKHIIPWGENPSTAWNPQWGYAPPPYNQAMRGSNSNDGDNSWAYSSDVGDNKPHENRMPYIVFAKIIKVK